MGPADLHGGLGPHAVAVVPRVDGGVESLERLLGGHAGLPSDRNLHDGRERVTPKMTSIPTLACFPGRSTRSKDDRVHLGFLRAPPCASHVCLA